MGEIESAEAFVLRMEREGYDRGPHDHYWSLEKATALIEARDAAVANQARLAALTELRDAYWQNRDTSWEAECVKLLEKYGQKGGG